MNVSPESSGVVRNTARAYEPDRYLAALLARPALQDDLVVLAAFAGETGRIRRTVREPLLGEIRLAWWREALEAEAGTRTDAPIADAFRSVLSRRALPAGTAAEIVAAHADALAAPPFATTAALEDHASRTEGGLFLLGALMAGRERSGETEALCLAAGKAYGLARMLDSRDVPAPLAGEAAAAARRHLADARQRAAALSRDAFRVFLPLALVEPYLRALEKAGEGGPWKPPARITPLSRISRLWLAGRRRRF